jgi:hypothetical protein
MNLIANKTEPFILRSIEQMLFVISVVSVFLFPSINFFPDLFTIRVEDIILPFIAILILIRKKIIINKYIYLLIFFGIYIFITILINARWGCYRDYFEIYKLIKFVIFLLFFRWMISQESKWVFPFFSMIFAALFIFNILHFFDVFHFNKFIEPFYAEPIQLDTFGLNSLGQPDTKRMLGTMGNPNDNAVLFLFFSTLCAPRKSNNIWKQIIFFGSYLCILACQSRTGFIAFGIIFIVNCFFSNLSLKKILIDIGIIAVITCSFMWIEASGYLQSLANSNFYKSDSLLGRYEVWQHLWQMIKLKPVFGYGPFKEYFYDHHLYPDSEYFLMTWRYGFIGLIFYLLFLAFPFYLKGLRKITTEDPMKRFSFLFAIVILVVSLTNNPISEPRILLMFSFALAVFFYKVDHQSEKTFLS